LLFSRFGRHEAHRRPQNCLANRFRIRSVVLVPLDVSLKDTSNNGRFCRVGAQRRVLFAI